MELSLALSEHVWVAVAGCGVVVERAEKAEKAGIVYCSPPLAPFAIGQLEGLAWAKVPSLCHYARPSLIRISKLLVT